jgi:hypothetical protein
MTATVVVQPPGHTVIIEHESIETLVLTSEMVTTIVEVPGPQGPPGRPGNSFTEVIAQPVPALVWTLRHDQNRYPAITLVDTANDQIIGDISYLDANTARVRFGAPTAGTAYLN